jgi:hypothetical protein
VPSVSPGLPGPYQGTLVSKGGRGGGSQQQKTTAYR